MADLALGKGTSFAQLRVHVVESVATREMLAVGALMAIALVLRLWNLDAKALHHDESLHATFSWYFYDGRGYVHDPLMHGPFQFHANALAFFLFGASDFTARLPHALFGTALIGLPYFLRRQIGMKAVFIAAALIAFSPTLLYFSRFDREDIYVAFWTLALVVSIWRYFEEQKTVYLGFTAAALALAFATKETTFITVAVLLLFLNGMLAIELGRKREGEDTDRLDVLLRTLVLLPVAWLVAAAWPLLGKQPFGRERLPPSGDLLVVIGTLSLPQFGPGIQVIAGDKGYNVPAEDNLRLMTVLILLLASAYVGLLWKPRVWLIAAAAFYVPFVLLFTTFFTNQPAPWTDAFWQAKGGFFSGAWGSLDYWLDQHHVRRGDQPFYYYALVTPLYEFLPLVLAAGGAAWMALRGTPLYRWLLFWTLAVFVGLSIAGEKMPWLETHIAMPLILVAAVALAKALDSLDLTQRRWLTGAAVAAGAAVAIVLVVEADSAVVWLAAFAAFAALAGWLLSQAIARDWQAAKRAALAIALGALFGLSLRAATLVSYENPDTPVELLVYTQTSPDIPALRDRIDAIARESGLGRNLPITVDGIDGFSWPWAWYLRDYHAVSYAAPTAGSPPPPNAVLLVSRSNAAANNPAGYNQTPYRHRWWFAETYRRLDAGEVGRILTSGRRLESLFHFFFHRRPATGGNVGSVDAVAFFPESLAAFDAARPPAKPPVEPRTLADGRSVIGRGGNGPGELQQPGDVFVDGAGSIYVADSRNNRIQKFDAAGNFVASASRFSGGGLNEPWSLAVDADGFVYVADTWNHRIVKLSPALEVVTTWGQPATLPNPTPLHRFGPRDVVIAPDGTLWISDTGNKRLVQHSRDGAALGAFGREGGGSGQFLEPVGLALDPAGRLYVADAWNARIQRFEPGFQNAFEFGVGWSSREVFAKPYIAVLRDGRIVAAEPAGGVLLLFDAEGRPQGAWRPETESRPVGVAALADGGFAFSDAVRNEVQLVPAALIARLFK